ncbi:mRNAional regulator ATRX-like isoform X3 [Huso huso]|uniref:mRNAional regulator ATRX-like isoform X3 n=1 Tax=Huso huso TaxID=61971 RepID=A0ABR0ZEQ9_HUSHU
MGTHGPGRKRNPNRDRLTAEDDALNVIAREAESRLAAKRAARAEARDIRMKELERQQKEIYQVQKKYYGLDNKWGDIEQWMEDSERYSRRARRNTSMSDDDERMSVGSRGSLRSDLDSAAAYGGAGSPKDRPKKKKSSKASSRHSDESRRSQSSRQEQLLGNHYSLDLYSNSGLSSSSRPQSSAQNGTRVTSLCKGLSVAVGPEPCTADPACPLFHVVLCVDPACPLFDVVLLCLPPVPRGPVCGPCLPPVPRGPVCGLCLPPVPRGPVCGPCLPPVPRGPVCGPCLPPVPRGPVCGPCLPPVPRGPVCGLCLPPVPRGPVCGPCLPPVPRGPVCGPCLPPCSTWSCVRTLLAPVPVVLCADPACPLFHVVLCADSACLLFHVVLCADPACPLFYVVLCADPACLLFHVVLCADPACPLFHVVLCADSACLLFHVVLCADPACPLFYVVLCADPACLLTGPCLPLFHVVLCVDPACPLFYVVLCADPACPLFHVVLCVDPACPLFHVGSLYEESVHSGTRRFSAPSSRAPSEYSGFPGSSSHASSRASSARASPVLLEDSSSIAGFLRSTAHSSSSSVRSDLDDVTIPDFPDVEERPERDFAEKGSRSASTLSAATLASLGGSSSRRGSGDTSISADTEASIREIKDIHELKDQIQDVESRYMQGLKEMKDSLAEVEEKYRKAMVSNAQLDNEKSNFMFQVDTMKDSLMELEEQLAETRRELDEKVKEHERERHAHSVLQFQFNEMKENLRQSEELLAEIRQLKLKQESSVREVSDLQETIEWKDKKIGALERQKEYFDVIRTERDELRDEIVLLQDVIKKHGIVLGAELTTNGEVGNTVLDSTVHADSVKRSVPDSTPVLQTPGDGLIGKATEVEMKISLLADVGNKEILQSAGDEAEKQESLDDDAETQEGHVGEKAEENLAENEQLASVPSDDILNDPGDVQQREQSDIASQASSYLLETAETDSTLGSNAIAQSSVDDINQNDIHEHSPVLELTYSVDNGIVEANSLIAEGEIMSERETEVINREDEGGKEVVQVIITGPDDDMESETEQALSDKEAETTEKSNSDGQQSVQSAEEMRIEGGETKTQEESLNSNKAESITGCAVTDKVSDEENAEHEVAQDPTEKVDEANSTGKERVQKAADSYIEGKETQEESDVKQVTEEVEVEGLVKVLGEGNAEKVEHEMAPGPTEKVDEANCTGEERVQTAKGTNIEGKETREESLDSTNLEGSTATEGDVKQVAEKVEVKGLVKGEVLGEGDAIYEQGEIDELVEEKEPVASTGNEEKVEHEIAPGLSEKVDEANCTGEGRVQKAEDTHIEGKETQEESIDSTNVKQITEKVEVEGLVKGEVLGEGDAIYEQGEIDELVEEKEPVASTGNEEKVEHEIAPGPSEKVDEANCTGEGRVQKAEDTHIEGKETQEESIDSTNVKQITEKVEVEGLAVDKVLEEEKMIPEEGEVDKIMENKEPGASTGSEEKVEHEIAQGPTEKVEEKVNHAGDDRVRSAEDTNTKGTQDENIDSTDIMEMTVTEGDVKQVTEKVGDESLVQLEKTGITGECQEELDSDVVKSKDGSSCEVQKEHEEQEEVTMETKAEQIKEEVIRECVTPSLEHGQESGEIEGSEKAPQSIAIGEAETLCNDSTVMEEVTVRSDIQAGNEKQEFVSLETETKQEEVVLAGDGMTPTMVHREPDSEDKGVSEEALPHRPEDEPEVSCESDTTNNNVEGMTDENDSKEKHGEDLTASCFVEEVDQGEVSIPLEDKGGDIEEAKKEVGNSSQKDEGEGLKQDDLKEDSEKKVQSQKTEDQNKEDKLENETNLKSRTAAEQGVEGIANVETVQENIMGRVIAQGSGDDVKEEPLFGGEGQKVISEDYIETIEEETRTVNKEVKGTESQNIDPAVVKDVIESKGETIVQCEICVEKVDVELDHQDNYLDEEIHPENLETVGTVAEDSKPSDNSELAPADKVASQSTVEVETLKDEKINQGLEPTVTAADNIKSECMLPDGSEQEKTDIGKDTDETVIQQTTADISKDAILEEMATAEKKVDVFNLEKERESKDQEHEHQDEAQEVKQEVTSKEEVKEKSTEKVEENIPDDVQEKEQAPAKEEKQGETQLTQKEEEKGEAEEEEEEQEEGEEDNEEDEEGEKFEFDDEVGQDLEESDQKVCLEDPLKEKETQQQGAETNDSSPVTKTDSQDKEQRSEKGDADQLKTQDSESEKTGGEQNQKEMEEVCSAGSQGSVKESGERGQQGEDGNKQGDIGRELEKELGEGTKRQSISEDSVGEPVGQTPDSVQDTEDSKSGSTEDLGKQDAAKGSKKGKGKNKDDCRIS